MKLNEEQKVIQSSKGTDVLTAFNKIPYALLNEELDGNTSDLYSELREICNYYKIYKKGADFNPEGTNGDYLPAMLKYRQSSTLINKEARFLFAEAPDITIEPKGDVGKTTQGTKDELTNLNDLVRTILSKNMFEMKLLQAAKDCFIGKRVAGLVNFNEEDGVTIEFLNSTQFIYETKLGNNEVLTKFVAYIIVKDTVQLSNKRIFKKKYVLEDGIVYVEEMLYDGAGMLIEEVTPLQPIDLPIIPAVIFINDGLLGEQNGVSEIEIEQEFEEWFNKLSSGNIDSTRKSMNPVRYTIDMESNSTKSLSTSAGSYWDLQSDQNLTAAHPAVGLLESNLSYSASLNETLDRIKTAGYEALDVPNITMENLQGVITSGKALKSIYWSLIIRCKEKFKMWSPKLSALVDIIIKGAMLYPSCITEYTNSVLQPVDYEINIEMNTPLPEDEQEEKASDLAEVESQTMSRKSYMKKWRKLSDDEVMEELQQIALERQLLEDSFVGDLGGGNEPLDEPIDEPLDEPIDDDVIVDEV